MFASSILILGTRGSGKTTFLNFLRDSLNLPPSKPRHASPDDEFDMPTLRNAFPNFISHFVESEVNNERIGITLWDSDGLESNMADLQIKEITNFIESKFENTYAEESKVARTPGFRDKHIHCTILLLDPRRLDTTIAASTKANEINGNKVKANSFVKAQPEPSPGGLDTNLDLNVLRSLKGKTAVVPIIAKADTITNAHMNHLKHAVWQSLKQHGLETLDGLAQVEGDEGSDTSREDNDRHDFDERDEDRHRENGIDVEEEDKFSMTSHLDSPSDSGSDLDELNFGFPKPEKAIANSRGVNAVSEIVPPVQDPPIIPLSIISPDPYDTKILGRRFPWGVADPYNKEHCDFTKLKELVFKDWRGDLREASREIWYEGWRTSRLNKKARRNGTISLGVNEVRTAVWAQR